MSLSNDTFLRACKGEKTPHVPVWFMRQAGRSQPEYRKIKETHSLFDITKDPELCAYVTRLPVEQYGVDAAILYKDIMTPFAGVGVDVDIKTGVGPVIDDPIRTRADIERIGQLDAEASIPYILDTIRLLKTQLDVPLIGFSGAPFTLASYLIEGRPSKNYHRTKAMMYAEPEQWQLLMNKLGDMIIAYVKAQVDAGVDAIQLFDSWVGAVSVEDYRIHIKPVMTRIVTACKSFGVPVTMFGVGASHLAEEWHSLPIDVVGLDWRLSVNEARERGLHKTVMGNLDPSFLLAPWPVIEARAKAILDQGLQSDRFIFNLGHGVFPEVSPATLKQLTTFVHTYSREVKDRRGEA
ncbi:uroporphyrinogen decarboxylase [Aureibacillus halotolerans]|uniref:Uroporphyrinogen decarboxylase n=1 Tax=Aureibacillus halotolerans TaxID=1508390 RepID=A0A4R6UAE5_9BACI|nr:uroporphyrinogen decarboxylase [Aureibacillus halotolerans]TDQ42013.1 uroporphyrinogen decarboxylase [Aureibacillus halotolerans]